MVKAKYSRICKLILMFSMFMVSFSGVSFAEGEIYDVIGYTDSVDFTVSNVIDTFDASKIDSAFDAGLVAEAPVEITLENDGGSSFGAYRLEEIGEDRYGYNPDDQLDIIGEVQTRIPIEGAQKDQYGRYKPDDLEEVTLDISELDKYEYQSITYLSGAKIFIEEPGDYYVMFRIRATMGATEAFIKVVEPEEQAEEAEAQPQENVEAMSSNARIIVDGIEVDFDAYNINGNNFFKLRDLAYALSNSEKPFDVIWDNDERVITITTGSSYTEVGGEMTEGDGEMKNGILNRDPVQKDGEVIELLAYNIGGNNYFKLRDIASELDFGVTWDAETKTVEISTDNAYTE
ncbi:MAG: hypothetical protein ACQEP4_07170 [Bacillota bacterium]